jgi:hypothetical protein
MLLKFLDAREKLALLKIKRLIVLKTQHISTQVPMGSIALRSLEFAPSIEGKEV